MTADKQSDFIETKKLLRRRYTLPPLALASTSRRHSSSLNSVDFPSNKTDGSISLLSSPSLLSQQRKLSRSYPPPGGGGDGSGKSSPQLHQRKRSQSIDVSAYCNRSFSQPHFGRRVSRPNTLGPSSNNGESSGNLVGAAVNRQFAGPSGSPHLPFQRRGSSTAHGEQSTSLPSSRRHSISANEQSFRRASQHEVFSDPVYNPILSKQRVAGRVGGGRDHHNTSSRRTSSGFHQEGSHDCSVRNNCTFCSRLTTRLRLSDLTSFDDDGDEAGERSKDFLSQQPSLESQFRQLKSCRYLRNNVATSSEDESDEDDEKKTL